VLVLSDVPIGYYQTRAAHPAPATTPDESAASRANAQRNRIAGCESDFVDPRGEPQLGSKAIVFRSVAATRLALRLGNEAATSIGLRRAPLSGRIGDEAALFVTPGSSAVSECAVAWRSGRVLKVVALIGAPGDVNPVLCVMLARIQQQRHRTSAG
jgi:hypothetical protein